MNAVEIIIAVWVAVIIGFAAGALWAGQDFNSRECAPELELRELRRSLRVVGDDNAKVTKEELERELRGEND